MGDPQFLCCTCPFPLHVALVAVLGGAMATSSDSSVGGLCSSCPLIHVSTLVAVLGGAMATSSDSSVGGLYSSC